MDLGLQGSQGSRHGQHQGDRPGDRRNVRSRRRQCRNLLAQSGGRGQHGREAEGDGRCGLWRFGRRGRRCGAKGMGERYGIEARRRRRDRFQCQRTRDRAGRGELAEGILHRHDGNGASGRTRRCRIWRRARRCHRDDLQRFRPRSRLCERPLWHVQGCDHPLYTRAGQPVGRARVSAPIRCRQATPTFEGGVWNTIKDGNPELYKTALALNPTGRMGTPQEMANAVVFLASRAASFITGTNLVVDGALTRGVQF